MKRFRRLWKSNLNLLLQNKHSVAVAEQFHFVLYGHFVCGKRIFAAIERGYQQDEGTFRPMEVGQKAVN